jgi:hypothetical protein
MPIETQPFKAIAIAKKRAASCHPDRDLYYEKKQSKVILTRQDDERRNEFTPASLRQTSSFTIYLEEVYYEKME